MSSGTGNSFRVKCPSCGKVLMVPLTLAGKKAKCPGCGNVLQLPAAPAPTPTPAPAPQPPSQFASPANEMGSLLDEALAEPTLPRAAAAPSQATSSLYPTQSPYATQTPQPTMRPRVTAQSYLRNKPRPQRSAVDTGAISGGLGMMAIAVIWFFGGLFFGYLFFFPPILFIIGFVSFCKGLVSTVFK